MHKPLVSDLVDRVLTFVAIVVSSRVQLPFVTRTAPSTSTEDNSWLTYSGDAFLEKISTVVSLASIFTNSPSLQHFDLEVWSK